jgi:hypothetical protein
MKRPSAMKNVGKGGKAGARSASFLMAEQPPLHVCASKCFIDFSVFGAVFLLFEQYLI